MPDLGGFDPQHEGDGALVPRVTLQPLDEERVRTFWAYRHRRAARTFFTRWNWRAAHSRPKPMAAVAKLIQRHLPNLLTYLRHRLTNAGLEGLNAVIQGIKKTARGFRNAEHFKTAIYFHCGGLDLYPHETR